MRTLLKGLLLSCVLAALAGCGGMTGAWKWHSIEPESAKGDFDFAMLKLNEDGTYMAKANYGGEMRDMTGTYTYDRDSQDLAFKTAEGEQRAYKAACGWTGDLKVWSAAEGKDWKATMKRCKGAKKCCCPDKCPPSKCAGAKK